MATSPDGAPHIIKYTPELRRHYFEAGKEHLYTYCKGLLGFPDMTEQLHWELCEFLMEKTWLKALIAAFRGSLKSSIATVGFSTWLALYVVNHSTRLVEQKEESAKINHFRPIVETFRKSDRADFLYWLYGEHGSESERDMMRIPDNFKGWTKTEINMIQTDPLRPPALTYCGIESAQEGYHGNLILMDDLEGADAEKSEVSSEDAYRFVTVTSPPLLRDLSVDRQLVVGTPHGENPVVWRIRDFEDKMNKEGEHIWHIFWKEVLDSEGESRWPERFTPGVIAGLKINPRLWDTQYMLRRRVSGIGIFDMDAIKRAMYTVEPGKMLRYIHREWDISDLDDFGYPRLKEEWRNVSMKSLRYYELCDPKHRERTSSPKRASEAAIVVIGVAPDGHVFVISTWSDKVGLERYAEKVYLQYRKYRPLKVAFEAIGAQHWFWDYARLLERGKYRSIMSLVQGDGKIYPLPKLTSRLVEAERKTSLSKEEWIIGQLDSWFSFGVVHLHDSQEHLLGQCSAFPDPVMPMDVLDALSQFPAIIPKSYPTADDILASKQIDLKKKLIRSDDDIVGYIRPWTHV